MSGNILKLRRQKISQGSVAKMSSNTKLMNKQSNPGIADKNVCFWPHHFERRPLQLTGVILPTSFWNFPLGVAVAHECTWAAWSDSAPVLRYAVQTPNASTVTSGFKSQKLTLKNFFVFWSKFKFWKNTRATWYLDSYPLRKVRYLIENLLF